jgi:hypothetical protein
LIAATPTDPVAHCTTRRLMNTFYTIGGGGLQSRASITW